MLTMMGCAATSREAPRASVIESGDSISAEAWLPGEPTSWTPSPELRPRLLRAVGVRAAEDIARQKRDLDDDGQPEIIITISLPPSRAPSTQTQVRATYVFRGIADQPLAEAEALRERLWFSVVTDVKLDHAHTGSQHTQRRFHLQRHRGKWQLLIRETVDHHELAFASPHPGDRVTTTRTVRPTLPFHNPTLSSTWFRPLPEDS